MKSRLLKILIILAVISGTFFYCSYIHSQLQIMSGETMNTYYRITIRDGREDTLLHNEIKDELQSVNNEMSVFEHMSDISQFNKSQEGEWIEISKNLAYVLQAAHQIYNQTNGYFDPSVGKLVDLWGFGTTKTYKVPTEEEIQVAKRSVGLNKINFSRDYRKAKKTIADISINLSAIAKGYAVDRIAKLLEKEGYTDFIVEIGGEVKTKGRRAKKAAGWNVGVARPENNKVDDFEYIITMKDMAVATSGDYRNYFYIDGKRYSHTIDPKTGYPVEHNLAAVTVFDKECMRADGLATGIMSMGEAKGLDFANNHRIAAIMFVHTDDGFQTLISNEAKKLLNANKTSKSSAKGAQK